MAAGLPLPAQGSSGVGVSCVHRLRNLTGEEPGEDEGRRATGGLPGAAPGLSAVC